jgi:cyclophilin family peptidyl-prolyl cis-trans isomerase
MRQLHPPVSRALGVLLVVAAVSSGAAAQEASPALLTADDSVLVALILAAEEARDVRSPAFANAERHRDPTVRGLAARARARITDSTFAARDALLGPAGHRAPASEPAWKLRLRALTPGRDDCALLLRAVSDSAWPVRQRASVVARASCAANDSLVAAIRRWVDSLPPDASRHAPDAVSWQPAAYGIVALARLRPDAARPYIARLAQHSLWLVRLYAAGAAAPAGDLTTLRALTLDPNENVAQAAIEWLGATTGRADDALFVRALSRQGAQSVRAAATALRGTAHPEARDAAWQAFERFAARANASERDVRVALLHIAGRAGAEDRPPPRDPRLPPEAVDLALGAQRYLQVELDAASGGGSFVVRLRGDVAPIMAARVLTLAREGHYDGSSWHRVEHDFVIQGGSPDANEYVGYRQFLVDELGTIPHPRGSVGMSTRGHDTGDAQWFVNLRDNPRLRSDYTVFAEVVEGMPIVDGIIEGDRIERIREVRRLGSP